MCIVSLFVVLVLLFLFLVCVFGLCFVSHFVFVLRFVYTVYVSSLFCLWFRVCSSFVPCLLCGHVVIGVDLFVLVVMPFMFMLYSSSSRCSFVRASCYFVSFALVFLFVIVYRFVFHVILMLFWLRFFFVGCIFVRVCCSLCAILFLCCLYGRDCCWFLCCCSLLRLVSHIGILVLVFVVF